MSIHTVYDVIQTQTIENKRYIKYNEDVLIRHSYSKSLFCKGEDLLEMPLRCKKIFKYVREDDSGNVLLFSVIVLLFLVFVVSVISLSVSNRVRVVRKNVDNSQAVAEVMRYSKKSENAIQQILNQCDELARYYVSRRYYMKNDTDFNGTGSNAELDEYLKKLISTNFQMELKANMSTTTGMSSIECTKVVFAYLVIARTTEISPAPDLDSIPLAIDKVKEGRLSIQSKSIDTLESISKSNPSLITILNAVKANKAFLEIEFELSYNTNNILKNTDSINISSKYHISSYSYAIAGIDILKPSVGELKLILDTQKHQIHNKMTY